MEVTTNTTYLHTGPHHDDIMLGIMPNVTHHIRQRSNNLHFAVLTSGFTAVTNDMLQRLLEAVLRLIDKGEIQMLNYPNFFEEGYLFKWDKDVNHYLNQVANRNEDGKLRGVCHRLVRAIVDIYKVKSVEELVKQIEKI